MSKAKEQPKSDQSKNDVESGASEPAAEEAEHALEGSEADELRKAESAAKDGRKA
jgi:hypothetical protein